MPRLPACRAINLKPSVLSELIRSERTEETLAVQQRPPMVFHHILTFCVLYLISRDVLTIGKFGTILQFSVTVSVNP